MELVERWWNSRFGGVRRDLWLGRDGDRWHIWWAERLDLDNGQKRLDLTEDEARGIANYLRALPPESVWRALPIQHRRRLTSGRGGDPDVADQGR